MRWSLSSSLLFALFGLAVLGALNLAGRIAVDGPTMSQEMHATYEQVAGKDAVSLGGSVGTAVDFGAMCVSGTRFFNNGQDLFEARALVDLILSQPDHPELFFIVLSPGSIGHDNGLPVQAGTYRRRATYRVLQGEGRWDLIEGDWRQAFLAQAMPSIGQQLRDPWLGALLRHAGRVPAPVDPQIAADTASVDPAQAGELARIQAAEWRTLAEDTAYFDPNIERRTRAALVEMAQAVRRADARLIVVIPPYIAPLTEELHRSNRAMMADFAATVEAAEAAGATVLSSWGDEALSPNYALFRDAIHLNAPGAAVFSRRLARELEKRRIIPAQRCEQTGDSSAVTP